MKVQLFYFAGCPHVDEARRVLRSAPAACGAGDLTVEEIDVEASTAPRQLRSWGSPRILVDGTDVAGADFPMGLSCRLYPGGTSGIPPRELTESRLRQAIANPLASREFAGREAPIPARRSTMDEFAAPGLARPISARGLWLRGYQFGPGWSPNVSLGYAAY